MDGVVLLLVIACVGTVIWIAWPFITNTRTRSGNMFFVFPIAILFALGAVIAWRLNADWPVIAFFALIASAFVVCSAVLQYRNQGYQVPGD